MNAFDQRWAEHWNFQKITRNMFHSQPKSHVCFSAEKSNWCAGIFEKLKAQICEAGSLYLPFHQVVNGVKKAGTFVLTPSKIDKAHSCATLGLKKQERKVSLTLKSEGKSFRKDLKSQIRSTMIFAVLKIWHPWNRQASDLIYPSKSSQAFHSWK